MENRKDILSKLLISEEDTLDELQELVAMATEHIKIEKESGEVLFISTNELTNKDKIALLLIGRYFSKELGLCKDNFLGSGDLSEKLNIPSTTLSKPLGQLLLDEKVIKKTEDGKYSIVYHKIKSLLKSKSKKNG